MKYCNGLLSILYFLILIFCNHAIAQNNISKEILWTTDWSPKGNLISEGISKDYLWGVSWNEKGDRIITSSLEQRIILWNKKAKRIVTIE